MPPSALPFPVARLVARGRPAADPACAGCAQLGTLRALRRAGLDIQGGLGCDAGAARTFEPAPGRWAAVAGAERALADARALVASAGAAGARLVVVADAGPGAAAPDVAAALARGGAREVIAIDPADLAGAESAAREALAAPAGDARAGVAALVALAPCARAARIAPPLSVAAARCNRCGACLGLGCPALSDTGGEAMVVDAALCTGCGLCAALCRSGALHRK